MFHYQILEKKFRFNPKINLKAGKLLAFEEFKIFVYFKNGKYQFWDMFQNKLLGHGEISPQLIHFVPLSNNKVAYYDIKNFCLRVLDLNGSKIIESKAEPLPTNLLLPMNEKSDDSKVSDAHINLSTLISLPESDTVVLLENKVSTQPPTTFENIITVFKIENFPTYFAQHNYSIPQYQAKCSINAVNRKNLIVAYNENISEETWSFLIWDVSDPKLVKSILIPQTRLGTILNVCLWNEKELGFWVNPEGTGKPEVFIVTNPFFSQEEEMVMEATKEGFTFRYYNIFKQEGESLLADVLFFDYEQRKAVLEIVSEQDMIVIFDYINDRKNSVLILKESDEEETLALQFEPKGRYFVQYEHEENEEDDDEEEKKAAKEIEVNILSLTKSSVSLYNLLTQTGVVDQYGPYISQEVVNILTND